MRILLLFSILVVCRSALAQTVPAVPAPATSAAADRSTPEGLPGAETIIYRNDGAAPLRIHVFKPEGWKPAERRPALMHFFGGGFLRGTPRNSAGWGRTAARWGMVGLAPDYRTHERFGTDATACVSDARAALRWVQEHAAELGIDPQRIVVSGSSAGGHLALWTAIRHSPPGSDDALAPLFRPAALVLFSAASDTSAALGQRADRFGGHGDACSPVHQLDGHMPPVFMMHGDADPTVPHAYAVALDTALRAKRTLCEFVSVPGAGHNINDAPGWREKAPVLVQDFLRRQGVLVASASDGSSPPREYAVTNPEEFAAAAARLHPGDAIVLRDGLWRDADLVLRGQGLPDAPIRLRAQTAGKVVLTGASRLRLAGSYLSVEGLVFRECVLQKGQAVVAFRDGDEQPASFSRLTQSAIIDCNPPDYLTDYKWVSLYGTDNRVDHCWFAGKTHQGTLLVVWLDGGANRHRIDHNLFGPRPPHDRNGAETIRVGTSDWAHTRSETLIESNVFLRCDGEQEIISNKSWGNTYRDNTFIECQGALTLRHGNAGVVEGNWFLGRGRENTGGVRIIGEDHVVTNNHFEGLTGDGYYAALSMVQGIPDSPASGYHQVRRPKVFGNTFIDCAHVFRLGVIEGRPEAVLPPESGTIADNLVLNSRSPIVHTPVELRLFRWERNLADAASAGEGPPAGFDLTECTYTPDPSGASRLDASASATGAVLSRAGRPLDAPEVGPDWRSPR